MRISYIGPKNFNSTVGNKHWEGLFISSLELSINGDEKMDIVRNGLLIIFDENEVKHFTEILQDAWNEGGMQ